MHECIYFFPDTKKRNNPCLTSFKNLMKNEYKRVTRSFGNDKAYATDKDHLEASKNDFF